MRKIFTYIAALAALLTVSCNRVEIEEIGGSDGTFSISLSSVDLQTRADEKQTAAEAKIDHFDWFFFSDAEGTTLIKHGRQTGSSKEFKTAEGEEFAELSGKSYFYAIANYPESIYATDGTTTLADLLDLPVKVAITDLPGTPFVMDSYDAVKKNVLIELSPASANEVRTQTVMMRRIAAKLVVNITVASSVTVGTGADAVIWKPTTTTKDFYMYMVNSFIDATGTKIAGTSTKVDENTEATKFYTYPQGHQTLTRGSDDLHWTSADYYSYPVSFETNNQKAPYFKVQIPWVNVMDADQPAEGANIGAMGTHMFYYKVLLPEIKEITRNTLYTLNLTLDKVGGTEEDYVIVTDTNLMVTNWLTPSGMFTGYFSARFLDCARDVYEFYGTDKMEIPVTSSHPIKVEVKSATKTTFNPETGAEVTTNVTDYTATAEGKTSFTIEKTLHNDITVTSTFDYTPIYYEVEVTHNDGKQPHVETVTVVQYPPIYVSRDKSNGYAYVNGYAHSNVPGGIHDNNTAYNNNNYDDDLGSMNWVGSSSSANNNDNQYVVTVSVLPDGYTVAGMTPIIGDPRGGKLSNNNLGWGAYPNYDEVSNVQTNYAAVSSNAQNVIAPQIRIASSWGATTAMQNFERAEERCAAYQENGYPAGRWRIPTVAEIDFLIKLSDYKYIPELFSPSRDRAYGYDPRRPYYYSAYWANGPAMYAGKPFVDAGNNAPYVNGVGTTSQEIDKNGQYYLLINEGNYFRMHTRCVYDQWYWGEEKYNSKGEKITDKMTGTDAEAATQWIGYKF